MSACTSKELKNYRKRSRSESFCEQPLDITMKVLKRVWIIQSGISTYFPINIANLKKEVSLSECTFIVELRKEQSKNLKSLKDLFRNGIATINLVMEKELTNLKDKIIKIIFLDRSNTINTPIKRFCPITINSSKEVSSS